LLSKHHGENSSVSLEETVFSDPSQKLRYKWRRVLYHAPKSHVTSQDPIYMLIANIMAPLGFSNYCQTTGFHPSASKEAQRSTTLPHRAPGKTYMSEISSFWRIHDPSRVAEEKEENGRQRRPEKGQESLENLGPLRKRSYLQV